MSAGFVGPDYAGRSLSGLLPAVAAALGVPLGRDAPNAGGGLELPPAPRYVVLLVDGLGHHLLRDHAADAPYLASLTGAPAVSVGVPSTTATSLTSLGTGLPPGMHGVVGYTSRIPGTDRLLNALMWSKRVDPDQWQPNPTVFGLLRSAGAHATVVNKRSFESSGLTRASTRGAAYVGADRLGERVVAVRAAAAPTPSLTFVYDGDLDWTGHRYGVASAQWTAELAAVDHHAERLRGALPSDARLVVVADHGMVDSPDEARVDVDEHPELRAGLALLGGEARFRHLYCRAGAVEEVVASWREVLGDRAELLTRDEGLERGWFGTLSPPVRPRLGDVLVACRGRHAVMSSVDFAHETTLVGMHGSLTPEEMLVPLLVD